MGVDDGIDIPAFNGDHSEIDFKEEPTKKTSNDPETEASKDIPKNKMNIKKKLITPMKPGNMLANLKISENSMLSDSFREKQEEIIK